MEKTFRLGTPLPDSATRVMLLGCGELGKEVIVALQRLARVAPPARAAFYAKFCGGLSSILPCSP